MLRKLFILIGLLLVAWGVAHAGPIYVYKEADGAIRFSSKKPPPGVGAKVFTAKNSRYSRYSGINGSLYRRPKYYPTKYTGIIGSVAKRYGVEKYLIQAVIHAESSYNPSAVSPKGALGLMQLMPKNVRRLGVSDPFSPHQNIPAGTRHLSKLLSKYSGNVKLALAAYNAGEQAVEKYGGVPPYRETVNYVDRVMRLREKYRSLRG